WASRTAARALRSSPSRWRQMSLQPPLVRSAVACSAAVATVASAALTASSDVSVNLNASRCASRRSSAAWRIDRSDWVTAWLANFSANWVAVVPYAHHNDRPVRTMNTIQQAKDLAGLLSCQAVAPRIGSPDLKRSRATPAMAYVQWATQVAPRVQPNSKANVADAQVHAMTAIPIRARKVIHIWQPLPAECQRRTNSGRFGFPPRTIAGGKVLGIPRKL